MLKNIKLSYKLWGLTFFLLLTAVTVALSSSVFIGNILLSSGKYANAATDNTFMVEKQVDHLNWINSVQDLFVRNLEALDVQIDHTKCGLGKFLYGEASQKIIGTHPELDQLVEKVKDPHERLHASASEIGHEWHQRHIGLESLLKDRLDDHRKWAATLSQIVIDQNPDTKIESDPEKCALGRFLQSTEYKDYTKNFPVLQDAMNTLKPFHSKLHNSGEQIKNSLKQGNMDEAEAIYKDVTLANLTQIEAQFRKAIAAENVLAESQANAFKLFEAKTVPALAETQNNMKELMKVLENIKKTTQEQMVKQGADSRTASILITVVAFVVGSFLSFFIIRSITGPIDRIIQSLNEGASSVANASQHISDASHSLADTTTEQAASVEETSSSLEELASMTKQNVNHTQQANRLTDEAKGAIEMVNNAMSDLTGAMEQIASSGDKTSKIIKTIDEIAFQTNLLALNAAVEAARAGEAGAGFAVVADEVRNLALRAAEAAKQTEALVQDTLSRVNEGSTYMSVTNDAFSSVTQSELKVAEIIIEISAASKEQALGLEQINKAVTEIDSAIQTNASSAEETSSSSEELNAMAEQMKEIVRELVLVVKGKQEDEFESQYRHGDSNYRVSGKNARPLKQIGM